MNVGVLGNDYFYHNAPSVRLSGYTVMYKPAHMDGWWDDAKEWVSKQWAKVPGVVSDTLAKGAIDETAQVPTPSFMQQYGTYLLAGGVAIGALYVLKNRKKSRRRQPL